MNKKVILVILDGWGHGQNTKANAVQIARTPYMDSLYPSCAHSELKTSGLDVGLPAGQMGNSEVGHLNIGAGRIVYQDFTKINKAILDGEFDRNESLLRTFEYVKSDPKNRALHLMGLVSDGGIHSHQNHLYKILELAQLHQVPNVFVHVFTDGRDTDPNRGLNHIQALETKLKETGGKIASLCGRFYAMDRDHRWERIFAAYDLLIHSAGKKYTSAVEAMQNSYTENISDEFVLPTVITDNAGNPLAKIKEGDAVISFNFRTDRCRQITSVLTQEDRPEFKMKKLNLFYVTMTNYDARYKNVEVLFQKDNLNNTLGEVLSANKKTQVRIAETEKYPHVTFFFSGGREKEFDGEKRILIPSPKVRTYDLAPEMSAREVTRSIVQEIQENAPDFICLNFANADMVGHTGNFDAVVKAVECADDCLAQVVKAGQEKNYSALIIADHGNAEFMINEDGSPNTAHTTNLVPCILIDSEIKTIRNGRLCDLAPTLLHLMGISIPEEMDGDILI